MTRRHRNILVALLLLHLAVLAVYAMVRIAGGDEGVYFVATHQVGLGNALYADFFYTQMPLLPTIFSPLALKGWNSFWILRGFAVLAGFLSAVLLFVITLKITQKIEMALVSLGLYIFSGLILSMHTIYESPVFAHCLGLATFLVWIKFREQRNLVYLIVLGLLLSALINMRATYIVLLPLYLWSVISLTVGTRLKGLMFFALPMIPPAIPTFLAILASPRHFFFDNYMFQIYRESDRSLAYFISSKLTAFFRTIIDPHLLIIIVLTVVSIIYLIRNRRVTSIKDISNKPEGMALGSLILIAFSYLFPHPILRHYFEQFMAFAIIIIALNLEYFWARFNRLVVPARRNLILAAVSIIYLLSLIPYVAIDIFAVRERERWRLLSEVKKVTGKMLELAGPTGTVLSERPLYPFLTRQPVLPYTEITAFHWPLPLDHAGFMEYKLCDSAYLKEKISARTPSLVTIINNPPSYYARELYEGYNLAYQSDAVSIFKRK